MSHRRGSLKRAAALLIAALLLALTGCSVPEDGTEPSDGAELTRYQASFLELFDTVTTVLGYSSSEEEFEAEVQTFKDELRTYHELYDIYNDYEGVNNIKTINDNAGGGPVEVDQKIIDLLLFCRDMYEKTGGKTNVMLGSVLSVWHDAREYGIDNPGEAYLPDMAELESAMEHTGFDRLVIDDEANTVRITDSEASLDVGAVAKGYAVQRVCETMPEGLLVSVGGNVCATGPKPSDGSAWVIGVQDPDGTASEYLLRVNISEGSLVSSGDYQRYYTVGGVRYCHIIDPATLTPPTLWRAVSVIYSDSGAADALSTALFCMDRESGTELLAEFPGAEALWIAPDGELIMSEGFGEYLYEE